MAQARDGRDLLETYQPGNRASNQRIVRTYQNEVVRSCFLLTGDAAQAVRLARLAFLDFFRPLMRGDSTDDPRESLLRSTVRLWLAGDHRKAPSSPGDIGVSDAGPVQHYHVDDERSRVLDALGRLSPTAQAGLELRDFNLLDEEAVCRILDIVPHELRREIQPARTKIQEVSGGPSDRSVRELLIDAATAAPRPDLWAELEGSLDELHQEEQERRQRYTYLAAALVGLALIGATFWLFDLFPAGDDSSAAAVATSTTSPAPTASSDPSPTPVPVPDISSLDLPPADIPARLLIWVTGNQDQSVVGLYNSASMEFTAFDDSARGLPAISPDGRFLVASWSDPDRPDDPSRTVYRIDSATGETVWETQVPEFGFVAAVTMDAVYIVISDDFAWDFIVLDAETGEEFARRDDVHEDLGIDSTFLFRRDILVSPDGSRLFVAISEIPTTTEPGMRILASYRLPEMILESVIRQPGTGDARLLERFWFSRVFVTPDSEYIYAVEDDTVRFRSSGLSEPIELDLPFSTPAPGGEDDLRWVTSNDGRYLYIIAMARQEAAVVDLLGRRLVRAFPLDPGEFGGSGRPVLLPVQGAPGTLIGTNQSTVTLSPDGSKLYLASGVPAGDGDPRQEISAIWVVDLTSWRIVDRLTVAGAPIHLAAQGTNLYVHTYVQIYDFAPVEERFRLVVFYTGTGEVVSEEPPVALPEAAVGFWVIGLPEWYRAEYGRLPAVEQVAREDIEIESTLPQVAVGASDDAVPTGGTVDIEARIVDPSTGEPLTADQTGVRFDPESSAVMRLSHQDGETEDLILIPTSSEPGLYRASATIEETGYWSVELTLTSADGTTWTVWNQRVFEGVPSFEATDGRRYILSIETDPAEPDIEEEVQVTARFVEIDTGDPLPPDEDLLEGAPDEMRLSFVASQQGATSTTVERLEEGGYEGTVTFHSPGVWTAEAAFRFRDGENVRIGAGTVTVDWN